jgi:hypothetical protein
MARKISNLNKGVYVMITPINSRAIGRIISRSGRTFSREVNMLLADSLRQVENNGEKEITNDALTTEL